MDPALSITPSTSEKEKYPPKHSPQKSTQRGEYLVPDQTNNSSSPLRKRDLPQWCGQVQLAGRLTKKRDFSGDNHSFSLQVVNHLWAEGFAVKSGFNLLSDDREVVHYDVQVEIRC